MSNEINRENAFALLKEYMQDEALLNHSLAVEAVMKYFANQFNEDEEKWAVIGLLHDIDYEKYPDDHCVKVVDILDKHDYPKEYIKAIQSHGFEILNDIKPEHKMEQILYTIDGLTGLINATALMRPSKSVNDLTVKSLRKKYKSKNFAVNVDRDIIDKGAQMLNIDLDELFEGTIMGMRTVASEIGLGGE